MNYEAFWHVLADNEPTNTEQLGALAALLRDLLKPQEENHK